VFWADALWAKGSETAATQNVPVQDWMKRQATAAQKLAALD
jgi:hypothetical protein